jgi:hypothetical protein
MKEFTSSKKSLADAIQFRPIVGVLSTVIVIMCAVKSRKFQSCAFRCSAEWLIYHLFVLIKTECGVLRGKWAICRLQQNAGHWPIAVYNCTGWLTESTVSAATAIELRLLIYAYRHQWSQLMRSLKGGVYKLSFVCWCSAREDVRCVMIL